MSAALKSYVPRPVPVRPRTASADSAFAEARRASARPAALRPVPAPPIVLPTAGAQRSAEPALRVLGQLHRVSVALSVSLVSLTLMSYAASVYLSRQLSQASEQLQRLERNEQQFTAANEILKNHLAQQTTGDTQGFQPPQPGGVIFLQPAPQTPPAPLPSPAAMGLLGQLAIPRVDVPLGY